jgi:hypothetical protein
MLYNELEQEDILSGVRLRLATIAYVDILLRSIGPVYKIRQTPDRSSNPVSWTSCNPADRTARTPVLLCFTIIILANSLRHMRLRPRRHPQQEHFTQRPDMIG